MPPKGKNPLKAQAKLDREKGPATPARKDVTVYVPGQSDPLSDSELCDWICDELGLARSKPGSVRQTVTKVIDGEGKATGSRKYTNGYPVLHASSGSGSGGSGSVSLFYAHVSPGRYRLLALGEHKQLKRAVRYTITKTYEGWQHEGVGKTLGL